MTDDPSSFEDFLSVPSTELEIFTVNNGAADLKLAGKWNNSYKQSRVSQTSLSLSWQLIVLEYNTILLYLFTTSTPTVF